MAKKVYTKDKKSFILPERELKQLSQKDETPQAQTQQEELIRRKEELLKLQQAQAQAQTPQVGVNQTQTPQITDNQTAVEKPGALTIAKNLLFGNYLEKNPITGEANLDAQGNPIQTRTGAPLLTAGAGIQTLEMIPTTAEKTATTTGVVKGFKLNALKALVAVGGTAGTIKLQASTAQKILTDSLTEYEENINHIKDGSLSPAQARQQIEEIKGNIATSETSAKLLSKLDVFGFLGLQDSLKKFETARRTTLPYLEYSLNQAEQQKIQQEQFNQERINMLQKQIQGGQNE